MRYLTLLSLLATTGLVACSAAASTRMQTPLPASMYRITDVTVVDVERGISVPGQTVLIVGDRIARIGSSGEVGSPEGAQTIDGRDLHLMPGLTDAHVHYLDAPVFGRLMIANGVLLVRDMGMPTEFILKLRDQLNCGEILGPEMVATGAMLDGSPPLIPLISLGIETPEDGRAAVRKQAAAGVDMIKVYSTLGKEVFLAIVDEARKHGLKVVGHVPDAIYLEDAAAAGLRSSEHWFGFEKVIARLLGKPVKLTYAGSGSEAGYLQRLGEVDPAALQAVYRRLRASGLTVVPTVVTFKSFPKVDALEARSLPGSEYISASVLSIWKSQWAGQSELPDFVWRNWAQMVNQLSKAEVPLLVGTDLMVPGIIPGYSVHEEMAIWQEAGIPAAEVLRSATIAPAQFMGLGARLGSVSEGKTASAILVRADPLADIRNAQQIEGVFLRGQYFSRKDLDRLLAEAKDLAQHSSP